MRAFMTSRMLIDEYSGKILQATMSRPMSAIALSERLGIPVADCYRKIRSLEKGGLLICAETQETASGKHVPLYKAKVLDIQIVYEENRVRVRLKMVDGTAKDYDIAQDLSMFM